MKRKYTKNEEIATYLDGLETLRRIREHYRMPAFPYGLSEQNMLYWSCIYKGGYYEILHKTR